MTWRMAVALAVPALLLSASSAHAQVIRGYESLDRNAGEAYYATLDFDVEGALGNSEFVDAEFSGAFGYKGDSQWVRFYPAYRLKRSDGENVIHDRSAHIRHSFRISERIRTFAFVQVQAEESIELERRFLIGGGIRSQLVRLGSGGIDLGIGLMLDEERRTDRDVRSDVRGANLFSIYGDAGVVELSGSIYFQPVIETWSDHRVLVLVSAIVPLVAHVSLRLSSFWRRDSRPPSSIEKHDSGVLIGFRLDVGLAARGRRADS